MMMRFFNSLLWFLPIRVRNVLLGIIFMAIGLFVGTFLVSILFVFTQFQGNARFPADCGLVFGSAVHKGGEAGPGIERRVDTAVSLWKEGSLSQLIFTGGTGEGNSVSEARVMRTVALRKGVEPEVLHMEEGATSTWQNVKFAEPHVQKCNSVVGISDRYHLARIRLVAWLQGVKMTVHPADRTADFLFELRAILRESLGNIAYILGVFT